jgi:hypothetical protein
MNFLEALKMLTEQSIAEKCEDALCMTTQEGNRYSQSYSLTGDGVLFRVGAERGAGTLFTLEGASYLGEWTVCKVSELPRLAPFDFSRGPWFPEKRKAYMALLIETRRAFMKTMQDNFLKAEGVKD